MIEYSPRLFIILAWVFLGPVTAHGFAGLLSPLMIILTLLFSNFSSIVQTILSGQINNSALRFSPNVLSESATYRDRIAYRVDAPGPGF